MAGEDVEIKVLNKYTALRDLSLNIHASHVVWVGRGSDWGNPFIMHHPDERGKVCDLFEKYAEWRLTVEPEWLDELKGKDLVCVCAPRRCHADTLRRLANAH